MTVGTGNSFRSLAGAVRIWEIGIVVLPCRVRRGSSALTALTFFLETLIIQLFVPIFELRVTGRGLQEIEL